MQQQLSETGSRYHFEALLTAEETAIYLRCHFKTVQKMARERRMPSIKRGKRHFFRLSERSKMKFSRGEVSERKYPPSVAKDRR
jgi:excisionase family DNA binding protein